MQINIRDFAPEDIKQITADGLNGKYIAQYRKIVTATDNEGNTADLYIDTETLDRLGLEYLQDNITLEYSTFLEKWYVKLSQNAYYNDIERYPEKIIDVKYIEDKEGEYTEIYKNIDSGQLYMRQLSSREQFARWLTCHGHQRYQYVDDCEVRANIIFKNGNEIEKITYDDWNGNGAYSNTFNPNFRRCSHD